VLAGRNLPPLRPEHLVKTNIRRSSIKSRRMTGFRRRMRTRSGRAIINRQRSRSCGRGKYNAKK
jgi:large subunit ribosomal protein L34